MRLKLLKSIVIVTCAALPLLAGALTISVGNPNANAEAQSKNAAALVEVLACHSPAKSTVTAYAISAGMQTVPLKVIALSKPNLYAVTHEWPDKGTWVIKFTVSNPDYGNYSTGALIPVKGNRVEWTQAKNYYHEPNNQEIAGFLQ